MKQSQEASASQWAQAEETIETIKHVESADTYAKKEAIDSYAELGLNAMRHSEKLEQQGKMKKPIAIAMENLFPESYGSHPDEMIYLVRNSRERMAEKLVSRGMSREMAEKKAREHLVATIDTGHMNMWRKYWKGDPNKSFEENDKDFDNWMVNKFEQMIKQGIVGHVHLVDNYGYQDDHLAPGEGNTPIRKMIEVLKKNNYKGEMIVEPGADFSTDNSGFHSVMKTWKHLDLPVYSSGLSGGGAGVRGRTWGDVGYGWFDQMAPPYFTYGGYSPTEEWTLWSGVQLE
jgi:sugar phosphate isomerase/epimerase